MKTLNDIKTQIDLNKSLTLDESVAGVSLLKFLKQVFPQQQFCLTETKSEEKSDSHLIFSGTFEELFPWKNVSAEFSLFDRPTIETAAERHAVFRLTIPQDPDQRDHIYDAFSYLSLYGNPNPDEVIAAISFSQPEMVFASVDYSHEGTESIFYPSSWMQQWPKTQLRKGLNCRVAVTVDDDVTGYVQELFQLTDLFEKKASSMPGLISAGERGAYFCFTKTIAAGLTFGSLRLALNGIGITLPLAQEYALGLQISFDGTVTVGQKSLNIRADLHAYYPELSLSFSRFPSLSELLSSLPSDHSSISSTYFPQPLSDLLKIQLSELKLVVDLGEPSVSAVSFRLSAETAIDLIPKVISIKPNLQMHIYAPFDETLRSVGGYVNGQWQLGEGSDMVALDTTLFFPELDFSAGLAKDKTLRLKNLLNHIGVEIGLLDLTITTMEVAGNFRTGSFFAEMEVATGGAWKFDLNQHSYSVEGIRIGFGIDKLDDSERGDSDDDLEGVKIADGKQADGKQWALSCEMEGHFKLCDATLFVSAQYDGDSGWTLLGGTEGETGLKVGLLIQDLFPQLQVPKTLNYLELTNLTLSAALKSGEKPGEYSISGQIKKWRPVEDCKFEVAVDEFNASNEGGTLSGMLIVVVSIYDISVRLSAEKKGGQDGGWRFKGSTGAGQKIPIDKVILWMAEQFGAELSRPEAIESCSISELAIEFDTATKDFSFKCDGAVQLRNTGSTLKGSVHIDITHVKETATYKFGGELEIDGLKFKLSFESEKKRSLLIGSYEQDDTEKKPENPEKKAIALDSLIGELLSTEVQTGLTLNVNRALLAYTSDEEGWAILCQINLGLDIDLGAQLSETKIDFLRTAGLSLAPGQHFGFDDLQIRYASQSFSANRVQAISRLLKGDSLALPASSRGTAPSSSNADAGKSTGNGGSGGAGVIPIEKGFSFSAKLNLGSSEQALVLPAGGNEKDSEGKQESKELTTAAKWFNIQKSFGPLHVGRLGFEYIPAEKTEAAAAQNDRRPGLAFLLDSSVELFGLRLGLIGFRIEAPLKAIMERDAAKLLNQITLDISGLELGLKQGPVEISGGLLRYGDPPKFVGNILIKTDAFAIFGFGAYETLNGQPSLFLFAALDMDLGGPPCFHVTGLAAGFGYNRRLTLPPIEKVETFPLVRAALEPSKFTDLAVCRGQIDSVSTAAVGDYWLAAGVKFTSFEMIESFVLLAVGFGTETVISILGLSKIKVPSKAPADVPVIAYAELALKVSLRPESGVLSAEALLTSNSYIFTKDCKITGGFAFYAWFKDLTLNEHGKEIQKIKAGDFVVTLGGYHPKFKPPAHYPVVPRLGLTWKVSDSLQISGELYFALTPNCLMLGGRLSALFQEGGLKAWFVVYADFLVAWNPLYYEATVGLRIGVAYLGTALGISINLSIELSAEVHLWGPPLSGRAEIHWSFISFTICFGPVQDKKPAEPLKLEDFAKSCLPPGHETLTVTAIQGLVKQKQDGEIIVNPYQLKLLVKSAVPSTKITVNGTPISIPKEISTPKELSIRPVQEPAESELEITIRQSTQKQAMQDQPVLQNVSSALWGEGPLKPPDIQKVNGSELLINDVLAGVELSPLQPKASGEYKEFVDSLKDLPFSLTWQYRYAEAGKAYEPSEVIDVVQHPNHGTVTYRSEILDELKNSGWVEAIPAEAVLEEAFRGIELQSPPVKCRLGSLPAFPIAWPYIDRERDLTTEPVESDVSSEEVDMVTA